MTAAHHIGDLELTLPGSTEAKKVDPQEDYGYDGVYGKWRVMLFTLLSEDAIVV